MAGDLHAAAQACLRASTPEAKVELTFDTFARFSRGELTATDESPAPAPIDMPGRPERPRLVPARELPKRGFGTAEGLAAFVHAIAHIEFNAIDLAWDAIYRYRGMPSRFYVDWASVANDEARHFTLLRVRLRELGYDYGAFDAHNGLWEMAEKTAHDGLARMALVPRVLEARGLDVTPGMIAKLRQRGDGATADILDVILREEVGHVAAGSRWFRWFCAQRGLEAHATFKSLLAQYARAVLYGPFNRQARLEAGFDADELASLESLAN